MGQFGDLLEKTKAYALDALENRLHDDLIYHNVEHTRFVAARCREMAVGMNVGQDDMETLLIAAYLHDVGYLVKDAGHEAESSRLAKEFLDKQGAPASLTQRVQALIAATIMPQNPQNLLEEILCDADMAHLGSDSFLKKTKNLRKDFKKRRGLTLTLDEWYDDTKKFMADHSYFTEYAKKVYEPRKADNLAAIDHALKKRKEKQQPKSPAHTDNIDQKREENFFKIKSKTPERGIETMFRTTGPNHLTLSSIADNKANIIISVTSIIISVLLTVLFRNFQEFPQFIVPTLILILVCVTSMVFAILATRPNITEGKFSRQDIQDRKTNLLFFGNFHRMPLKDYEWGMNEMMKDRDFLYGSMIRDIYFLGRVLGKKYRMLRIAYTIFMYGFIAALLSFALAAALYGV